ncbi:MAG: hypothetical protein PHP31_06025 [Lentimicrobiaceae bacterium]|nr:hypothetical protein [Lentimicrobiaceae bacterium]
MTRIKSNIYINILIFTAIVYILGLIVYFVAPYFVHSLFWVMPTLMCLITLYILVSLRKSKNKSHQHFIRKFLILTMLKPFVILSLIGIYALAVRQQVKSFAIDFLIVYFIYLFYEIYWLMIISKLPSDNNQ